MSSFLSSLCDSEEFYEKEKTNLEQCTALGRTLLTTLLEMQVEIAEQTVRMYMYLDPLLKKNLEELKNKYWEMEKIINQNNEQPEALPDNNSRQ